MFFFFFFQAEDGIRDLYVTGVQTCALPICAVEVPPQITRLVQLVEQVEGDYPVGLIGKVGADLLDQMLAQGARPRRGLVDPGQIARLARAVSALPGLEIAAEIASHLDRAVALGPG